MNAIKRIITFISAIALTLSLSSCTKANAQENDDAQEVLVIVWGNTSNVKSIDINSKSILDAVESVFLNYGYIAVVNADGNPDVKVTLNTDIKERLKKANPEKVKNDAICRAHSFLRQLAEIQADDPEIDLLKSLNLATRVLSEFPANSKKTIIVYASGLSTAGILDFNNNLLCADPQALAEQLYQKNEIPDFDGIAVQWFHMGDTTLPQQELSGAQVHSLQEIWSSIITKTSGTFEADTAPYADTQKSGLPPVTPITLPETQPITYDSSFSADFTQPQFLTEEQVQFVPDSDQYLNKDDAYAVISSLADCMRANEELTLMLIGTTAGDETNEVSLDLSRKRAAAVKNTLIEMGISPDRLISKGLGSNDPWHISGLAMSDPLSSANRKVVLLDAFSDIAKEID